jgi:hypothetical protein
MAYNINVEFQITVNNTDKRTNKQSNNQTKWSRQEIRFNKARINNTE